MLTTIILDDGTKTKVNQQKEAISVTVNKLSKADTAEDILDIFHDECSNITGYCVNSSDANVAEIKELIKYKGGQIALKKIL